MQCVWIILKPSPWPSLWNNCLSRNWSLVSKRLGATAQHHCCHWGKEEGRFRAGESGGECQKFPVHKRAVWTIHLYICCSAAQSCPTFYDPMDCSTPGFPVLHYLLVLAQTHVRWVGDAIKPSHPLSSPYTFSVWKCKTTLCMVLVSLRKWKQSCFKQRMIFRLNNQTLSSLLLKNSNSV